MFDPPHRYPTSTKQALVVLLFTSCMVGGLWFAGIFDGSTALEFAYRECDLCDISHGEVDQWVYTARWSKLDRSGLVRLFEGTLDDPAYGDECRPCLEAVLTAAGR